MSDFSLPTQRCFYYTTMVEGGLMLFSAYAEVFLIRRVRSDADHAFLCLRRGVSTGKHAQGTIGYFSLPTQRCFYRGVFPTGQSPLFSAYAEVFP